MKCAPRNVYFSLCEVKKMCISALNLYLTLILMRCAFAIVTVEENELGLRNYLGVNADTQKRPKFYTAQGKDTDSLESIILLYGESLELFCKGDADKLTIVETFAGETILPTEVVNKTTIRLFLEKPNQPKSFYECRDSFLFAHVTVKVEYPPEVNDFNCYSENFRMYNCTWTSPYSFNYTLFYESRNTFHPLCVVNPFQSKYCAWNEDEVLIPYSSNKMLHLQILVCNYFSCVKKTYQINPRSIVKLESPKNLQILSKTSDSVDLQCQIDLFTLVSTEAEIDFKVYYWFPGIKAREVNTSAVEKKKLYYRLKLELPCADTYYQMRVSVRSKKAIGEQYWSDPASMNFFTDAETNPGDFNPICQEQVKETKETINNKMSILKKRIERDLTKLKHDIKLLKIRAAVINKH